MFPVSNAASSPVSYPEVCEPPPVPPACMDIAPEVLAQLGADATDLRAAAGAEAAGEGAVAPGRSEGASFDTVVRSPPAPVFAPPPGADTTSQALLQQLAPSQVKAIMLAP
jgi:hypothetical protein